MSIQTITRVVVLMMWCGAVTGCFFSPIKSRAVHHYTLSTPSLSVSGKTLSTRQTNKKVSLFPITSSAVYGTTNMMYTDQPGELNYFVYQKWAGSPPQLLTSELTSFLLKHGFLVVDANSGASARMILKVELLELKQDFTVVPHQAVMGVRVRIEDARSHSMLIKTIYVNEPFYVSDAQHGVEAMNRAKMKMFRRIEQLLVKERSR